VKRTAVAVLALALAAGLGLPTPAAAADYVVDDGPRFNRPKAAAGKPNVVTDKYSDSPTELTDHLVELVRNTKDKNAIIRISLYGWDDGTPLTGELIKATERGVSVRILLDAAAKLDKDYRKLETAIKAANKKNPGDGSFIKRCGVGHQVDSSQSTGRACLGKNVNHNKYFLFSKVGSSKYVVVQGTGHITPSWGDVAWDAMMTVVGKKSLYDGYVRYFVDQTKNVRKPNYYQTASDGNYKAYFFPRAGNVPYTTSKDTIHGVLGNVTCTGNKKTGESGRTVIRILTWKFTRTAIAKKLRQLAEKGCRIDVVTNDSSHLGDDVRTALKHSRIRLYNGQAGGLYVHGKYLLIEGTYDGARDTKNIWVGSANLTKPALRENDEAILKIKSPSGAWHDDFRRNFQNIQACSKRV
jgi:phosphatidylserine/phosphatidylglycerophosphate/cardiolipin synthase-like enzyme